MAPTLDSPHPLCYLEYLLCNQFGHLCQGIGTSLNKGKHLEGTNTLFPILYDKIPAEKCREITYSKIVCKV